MEFLADPRAIEARSMAIIGRLLRPWQDGLTPEEFLVAQRVVHATGDPAYMQDLVFRNDPVAAGIATLRRRTVLICDVKMVAAGIRGRLPQEIAVRVAVEERNAAGEAALRGVTRALAGMRRLKEVLPGSIVAVGNAPTALFGVLEMYAEGVRPALVIGTPVGFVGALEAKEALLTTGLPAVVLRGTRGGSTIAAAVINALVMLAKQSF
ncbi:MAG: precorrin-8X methylmutase [Bacillota bacterium]